MYKAHVSEGKRKEVQEIKELCKKYKVIGIADMTNLPALQLQRIKQQLKDIVLKFTKKRLIKIAFDQLKDEKKEIVNLKEKLQGMPALLFTNDDAFELAKLINRNKSNAPAKPGQIAPFDLVIPAGPTNFMAGPMIGELGALGLKTKVESGKITIVDDKVLVKEGGIINAKQADLLAKVGIEPMKIGLNLIYTYKDGEVLSKDVLFIDEELYLNNLKTASREAVSLALEIGYVVKDTAELFVAKAYREAKALQDNVKIEDVKMEEVKEEKIGEAKQENEEIKLEPIKEEIKPIEQIKETPLEKEIREQKEAVEETAPKDEEDTVVIESKVTSTEEDAIVAKRVLDRLVTEKLAKGENPINQKVKLRERKEIDNVSKFINELKDKKAKGEI